MVRPYLVAKSQQKYRFLKQETQQKQLLPSHSELLHQALV